MKPNNLRFTKAAKIFIGIVLVCLAILIAFFYYSMFGFDMWGC